MNRYRQRMNFLDIVKKGDEKEISEMMETFETLDLMFCDLCDDGACKIGSALRKNISLISLNLKFNRIMDTGAKYIAIGLKQNESLKSLLLGWNNIDNDGANEILLAFTTNFTLFTLDLSKNLVSKPILDVINCKLERNLLFSKRSLEFCFKLSDKKGLDVFGNVFFVT